MLCKCWQKKGRKQSQDANSSRAGVWKAASELVPFACSYPASSSLRSQRCCTPGTASNPWCPPSTIWDHHCFCTRSKCHPAHRHCWAETSFHTQLPYWSAGQLHHMTWQGHWSATSLPQLNNKGTADQQVTCCWPATGNHVSKLIYAEQLLISRHKLYPST